MRNPELHKRQLIKAMRLSYGIISMACEMVKVSQRTYYKYLETDPLFREMIEEIYNKNLDMAEHKLLKKALKDEEEWAIKYFLNSKGKKRGYGINSTDITSNGKTINVVIDPEKENE
jgi:hypothetical protein